MKTLFGIVLLFLIALPASAAPVAGDAGAHLDGYLKQASQSGEVATGMLCQVFGGDIVNAVSAGSPCGASGKTMLGSAFTIFNAAVLAFGIMILSYTVLTGVIQTAHDGEFLGKRYHSFWMPARTLAGTVALIPVPGLAGWSAAQATMMWLALMGSGVADMAWKNSVNDFVGGQSQLIATPPSKEMKGLENSLIEASICRHSVNASINKYVTDLQAELSAGGSPALTEASIKDAQTRFPMNAVTTGNSLIYTDKAGSSCGGAHYAGLSSQQHNQAGDGIFNISDSGFIKQAGPKIEAAHLAAMQRMAAVIDNAAEKQVEDYVSKGIQPNYSALVAAADAAAGQYSASVRAAAGSAQDLNSSISKDLVKSANHEGWVTAGAFYTSVSKVNANIQNLVATTAEPVKKNISGAPYQALCDSIAGAFEASKRKYASSPAGLQPGKDGAPGESASDENKLSYMIGHPIMAALNGMTGLAKNDSNTRTQVGTVDPIVAAKTMGDYALDAVGILSAAGAAAAAFVPGVAKLLSEHGDFVRAAVLALSGAGLMLSVWIPLQPALMWLGAIISWLVAVAEGVIAAPLWAMTHLDAEGEGVPQKSAHGYTFMLTLFFRPILLVIGFILAMAIVKVVGGFWLSWFRWVVADAETNTVTGLFMLFGFLFVFIAGLLMIINKTFEYCLLGIPKDVIAWVGGHAGNIGGGHEAGQGGLNAVGGVINQAGGKKDKGNEPQQQQQPTKKGK